MAKCKVLREATPTHPDSTEKDEEATPIYHHGDGQAERGCIPSGEGGVVTVLFPQQCARFVGLSVGRQVRIHPPW